MAKVGDLRHPHNAKRRIIETLCQIIVSNGRDLLSLLYFLLLFQLLLLLGFGVLLGVGDN